MFSQRWSPRPRRVRPNLLRFSVHLSLGSWPPSSIAISSRARWHNCGRWYTPTMTRRILTTLALPALTAAVSVGLLYAQGSAESERPPNRIDLLPGWNLISFPATRWTERWVASWATCRRISSWGTGAANGWLPHAVPRASGAARGRRRAYGQAEAIGCTRLPTMPSKRRSRRIRPSPPRRGAAGSCWEKCR